jgi:hypothetical protein
MKSLRTMAQSMPAATADFSPRGESSTTSVSSLVALKRFKLVRYGSGCGRSQIDRLCSGGLVAAGR